MLSGVPIDLIVEPSRCLSSFVEAIDSVTHWGYPNATNIALCHMTIHVKAFAARKRHRLRGRGRLADLADPTHLSFRPPIDGTWHSKGLGVPQSPPTCSSCSLARHSEWHAVARDIRRDLPRRHVCTAGTSGSAAAGRARGTDRTRSDRAGEAPRST